MSKIKKQKESISLFVPVINLRGFSGQFKQLPPNKTFTLVIDYPLSKPAMFKINTGRGGMTLLRLLAKIGKAYKYVYEKDEKFGIWGHDIYDLSIGKISINHKTKKITLDIGS